MPGVLELHSISKCYGPQRVVDGLTLQVDRGEFFSLLGPSGCGKTTTLRMIAGFEQPDEGRIVLNGADVAGQPPNWRDVSTVFQNYALFPHMTVAQNVRFGLEQSAALAKEEVKRRVGEMLELLRLQDKAERKPAQLSGGERQRVALARSLVLRPAVLLLDEPLSALDPQLRRHVRSELKGLQTRLRVTFLFITHDQEEALSLADRVAVMRSGQLEQVGTPAELYGRPQTRFVADFLGTVSRPRPDCAIRPELLRVNDAETPEMESASGRLISTEYLGHRMVITLELPHGKCCAEVAVAAGSQLVIGDTVQLQWRKQDELPPLL